MEHAGIHRAPAPGLWERGGSSHWAVPEGQAVPPRVGNQSSALRQHRHSWRRLRWAPAPPTSAGGEGGNTENLSLSANKSMQVRLQGNLRRSLRRERPDGAGAAPTAPARRKIIAELLSRGSEALRMENKPAVCTFWVCLVQYKWNRVGCLDTASTSPISGRRR